MIKNNMEDIWKYINKKSDDECWEWTSSKDTSGYGMFRLNGKRPHPHCLIYELTYKKIPRGLYVLHTCDNPSCCNPKHLFLGTQQDNIKDMNLKGRRFKTFGENNPNSKLTHSQVDEIRRLYLLGNTSYKKLGKQFNITDVQVGNIIRRDMWVI
jgi:hypothetical protein